MEVWFIMPHPLIGGAIKRCFCLTSVWCLTSVCRVHGPKSRTERHRKTKIGTETAHVTRDLDTTFKVKRSRSPGCFIQHGLNRNAAAVVSVETYSAWESTATLRLLGGERREERGGGILCRMRTACFMYGVKTFSDLAFDCTSETYSKPVLVSCANRMRPEHVWRCRSLLIFARWRDHMLLTAQPDSSGLDFSTVQTIYLLTYLSLLQMGVDIWLLYHASKLVHWSCTESFDIFRSFKLFVFPDDDEWCWYAILTCIRKLEASI